MVESINANKPIFSIIIPTYNTSIVLMQCLQSLCHQSADKSCLEVIVVNDGGKNNISENLGLSGSQLSLKYLYQEHKGPAAARNLGIKKAKGDIIIFLDDDSLPTKDWLNATIKAWQKSPDFDGIGGYTISELTDSIYCKVNSDFFNWYLDQHLSGEYCTFLVTCNAGYKKAILNKVGLFDERFKKASGEDRDLNIKIAKIGGRLRLDKDILVYHDRDLTLRSFTRKNYNYGKAAHELYARYPDLMRLSAKNYINFYVSILEKYRTFKEKTMAFLLLTLSQISTLIGYLSAILTKQEQKRL